MEHDFGYYHDLVLYEARVKERWNMDSWQTIIRMTNNPSIKAKQEVVYYDVSTGVYLIKVTKAVMEVMKKVVKFQEVKELKDEDENEAYKRLRKERGFPW